ncbi:MAG: decaprenyl-phosphate phosphoribosyltransferase [Chloroflexota bacterium]
MLHERIRPAGQRDRQESGLISAILVTARPRQWIKNGFVFAALVFAAKVGHPALVGRTIAAFLLFCVLSSVIYLLNDSVDAEADRAHPLKSARPIAAGRLPVRVAVGVAMVALVFALALSFALDLRFGLVSAAYIALMGAYTFYLKHLVLIDVFAIGGGFVLRAAAGAEVIHVSISPWLYLCTILLSLFLGFGKRRHELLLLEGDAHIHRRNLGDYTAPLLDDFINIVAAGTIIAYSLYTFYASNVPQNHAMMITIPFVLYGVFRYLLLVHRTDVGGAPEEAVWRDFPLLADVILWVVAAGLVLLFYKK